MSRNDERRTPSVVLVVEVFSTFTNDLLECRGEAPLSGQTAARSETGAHWKPTQAAEAITGTLVMSFI